MKVTDDSLFRPLSAKMGRDEVPGDGNKRKAKSGGAGRKWQAFLDKKEKDATRRKKIQD
jgi:hypothetical protein